MTRLLHIARKEWNHQRHSLFGYLLLMLVPAAFPYPLFFSEGAANIFINRMADMSPFFATLPLYFMVFVPALTMRTWAEERRAGTLELLATYPLSPGALVLGKFLGNFALLAMIVTASLPLAWAVASLGPLDWGPVWGAYASALLLGACCLAICQWLSAFTSNQITAFVLSFAVLTLWMLLAPMDINLQQRFFNIARGVLDVRDLYFYGALTAVFLVWDTQRLKLAA